MQTHDLLQVLFYFAALLALTPLLGRYMARVFDSEHPIRIPLLSSCERRIYQLSGIDPSVEMTWKAYLAALLVFNALGCGVVFLLQILQAHLPLNPQSLGNVPWALALNTAVSFMSNTNWQAYSGESTLSYATQMLGLTVQNFLSAATGIGALLALTRGLSRKSTSTIGNFWVDVTRSTLYVLLPLSLVFAAIMVHQGVVQTFKPYAEAVTLEGQPQVIPLGPAASQIAIKQLGTNGGGFFGVNSAHPFENPTSLSNFLQMLAILAIPSALTHTFGRMIGNRRHGWCLWGCMMLLLVAGFAVAWASESAPNPILGPGSNMEGKETRFGVMNSVLWATTTTAASNGSVNAMHDSFSPMAGCVALLNIMLGEVIFGGVGAGLYGMLMFVILTVFMAGLMVGRTPEYLGKKIEAHEITWAVVAVLVPCGLILLGTAVACTTTAGLSSLANAGPHGLSEILYAFSSAAGNNGSAFAGLNANTNFYNLGLALVMLVGRFTVIIPVLAIAGSLAVKKTTPASSGTFRTDTATFVLLLASVILIVGALTFFPALCLGPIMEHYLMLQGRIF